MCLALRSRIARSSRDVLRQEHTMCTLIFSGVAKMLGTQLDNRLYEAKQTMALETRTDTI